MEENRKGNSKLRKIKRENFVCKHVGEIRKLIEVYDTSSHERNFKIKSFVDKVIRHEIEYNFTTGWWDIFKFIKRTYDELYAQPENLQIISKGNSEYNRGINEDEIKIEDEYCVVWGCGKKLSLQEKLFGVKCIHHSHFVKNLIGVW